MKISNVLASVAVRQLADVLPWYQQLFGRAADRRPMPTLAEWHFAGGGGLQVYELQERAGRGSSTFVIEDMVPVIEHLVDLGLTTPKEVIRSTQFKVVMIKDPDGNSLAFSQLLPRV